MNPYEISQAASDSIQSLLDRAEQLGGLPETRTISQALRNRLLQLQLVQSKSWHALRHNNEQVEFIMARLESMDVLCGRLLPLMEVAERICRKRLSNQKTKATSSATAPARLKPKSRWGFFGRDELVDVVEAVKGALTTWLDFHEAISELLASRPFGASCEAFGVFPRLQTLTLEGYQAVPAVMSKINDCLTSNDQQAVIICGPSGVGKTSLAAHVASRPPDLLSDGGIEVHFGKVCSRGRGREVYHHSLLVKLQLLLHDANCQQKVENVDDAWNVLEEVLKESAYLVVLDDVWEKEILDRFLELRNHSCKFLVTCEDEPAYSSNSSSISVIHLGFNEVSSASTEILVFHSGAFESEAMPAAGTKLLKFCSHHPLSVSIVGEGLRSRRSRDWPAVLEHFRKKVGEPINWIAGVFCAVEFSLADLNRETQSLFQAFASLSWEEPTPLDCLKSLWRAVSNKSTLLLQTRELVRRCLLRRSPDFESYSMHELIVTYLEGRVSQAVEVLLKNSELGTKAAVAPWLVRYGNNEAKEVAEAVVRAIVVLEDEELHTKVIATVVDVLNSCSNNRELACKQFCSLVGPEITNLLCNAASPSTQSAVVKYMSTCFSDADYDEYGRGLIASGILDVLRRLLCSSNVGGVDLLVRNAATDVLGKLADTGDSYIMEAVVKAKLIHNLVSLLEPKSGLVHEGLITAIVKIAENGEATVEPILETDLIDKLLKLLGSRKNGLKCRALSTLQSLVLAGGEPVLSCLLEQGVLEELVPLLNSQSEDVRVEAVLLCQQIVPSCGGIMMDRVLKMKLAETLTQLLRDELDLARSCAAESLKSLVRAGGQPVVDRVSKAAAKVRTSLEEPEEEAEFEASVSSILDHPLPECS